MNPVAQLILLARRLGVPLSAAEELTEAQIHEAKLALEEAELSHDEIRRTLSAAVKATKPTGNGFYCWVRDVFDDHLVYEEETPTGTTLFQQPYSIDDAGKVTLGDAFKVKATTAYVPVKESVSESDVDEDLEEADVELLGDVVPLVEKAVRKDGTASIRLIAPGWGSSGYYGKEVLQRDGAKAFPKGTHMYWDHPTKTEEVDRPERSVKDLAAVTTSMPTWQDNGAAGPGLYAETQVRKPYQADVEELAPHIGVSIRTGGTRKLGVAEGRKGQVIQSLVEGDGNQSIDFVTRAGAGGQIVGLFEAARGRGQTGKPAPEGDHVSEQELKEARDAAAAAEAERDAARLEATRLREAAILREARDVVTEVLGKVEGLLDVTRARLVEQLSAKPPVKDGALDTEAFGEAIRTAAKEEIAYLAKASGSGSVTGLGGGDAGASQQVKESEERIESSLGRAFGLSEAEAKIAAAGRSH